MVDVVAELAPYGVSGVALVAVSTLSYIAYKRGGNGNGKTHGEDRALFVRTLDCLDRNGEALKELRFSIDRLNNSMEGQGREFRDLELRLAERPCMRGR